MKKIKKNDGPAVEAYKALQEEETGYQNYGLFDEYVFNLNRSRSKYIAVGIKPDVEKFRREIRFCNKFDQYIAFDKNGFTKLVAKIMEMKEISADNDDDETQSINESMFMNLTPEDDDVDITIIEKFDGIYQIAVKEKKLFVGLVTMQEIVDLRRIITEVYDNLNEYTCRAHFEDIVEKVKSIKTTANTKKNLRQRLMALTQEIPPRSCDRNILLQTIVNHIDFLAFYLLPSNI